MSKPNTVCRRCGQQYVCDDPFNDQHGNVCPSTMAELDRFKKQNSEFIVELTKLRAMRDGLVKLRAQVNDDCDCASYTSEIDEILEASQ